MTYPRKVLICLNDTPYYHVVARCVRRAWLWGHDDYAGKDYSHRKSWVLERLQELAGAFAIDICAFAVMSNHYHLILRVDQARAARWSLEQVVERWTKLFSMPPIIKRWRDGSATDAERVTALALIELWRGRLSDVSWYMRCLNEHLARRANAEDQCTGRFWEGRFKSQALLDEAGLLAAMAYVDLNPIRAGVASTPAEADFTSIRARIQQRQTNGEKSSSGQSIRPPLLPFRDEATPDEPHLPTSFTDYVRLLEWSATTPRSAPKRAVNERVPGVLTDLNVDGRAWLAAMSPATRVFRRTLRRLNHLRLHVSELGRAWVATQGSTKTSLNTT